MTAVLPMAVSAQRAVPGRLPERAGWGAALLAVFALEASRARVARVPLLFVAAFQSIGIMVLLRGVVARRGGDLTSASVVAGATVLVAAFVALNLMAQRIAALRANGGLERYAALGTPPSAVVLGTAAAFAGFTVPGAVVTAAGGAGLYGLPFGRLWVLVVVLPLAAAALAGVGALIGTLAPKPELATVLGQLGMSAVIFIDIVPRGRLPGLVQAVRAAVPSSYAADALGETFRAHVRWASVVADLGVCLAVAVAALALAGVALRRAARLPS